MGGLPIKLGSHCCHVLIIGHCRLLKWTESIEVEYESISSTQWYRCQICMLIQCGAIMGSQICPKYLQQMVHRWLVREGHDMECLLCVQSMMSCLSHCSAVFQIVFYWMDIFFLLWFRYVSYGCSISIPQSNTYITYVWHDVIRYPGSFSSWCYQLVWNIWFLKYGTCDSSIVLISVTFFRHLQYDAYKCIFVYVYNR